MKVNEVPSPEFRAADLAKLLGVEVFDRQDAARFLGIDPGSLEYASYRGRIKFVQYGSKKWYTRADLLDYARARGRGRESQLKDVEPIVVKKGGRS